MAFMPRHFDLTAPAQTARHTRPDSSASPGVVLCLPPYTSIGIRIHGTTDTPDEVVAAAPFTSAVHVPDVEVHAPRPNIIRDRRPRHRG
jgi:hypothetical protein